MKKRRGRPKNATKNFLSDPDRYIIAFARALLVVNPKIKFEHAVMSALYLHCGELIDLPAHPLTIARRLGLSARVREELRQGWVLQQWGAEHEPADRDVIGNQVDRVRKKAQRTAVNPNAVHWIHIMTSTWVSLFLGAPNIEAMKATVRELGEAEYFCEIFLRIALP